MEISNYGKPWNSLQLYYKNIHCTKVRVLQLNGNVIIIIPNTDIIIISNPIIKKKKIKKEKKLSSLSWFYHDTVTNDLLFAVSPSSVSLSVIKF